MTEQHSVSQNRMKVAGVTLAAGKGTRMKSDLPKALHTICGEPMVKHVLRAMSAAGFMRLITVVGHKRELLQNELGEYCEYVVQQEQLGTGHAAQQLAPLLQEFEGLIVFVPGDAPLISSQLLRALTEKHMSTNADCTLATVSMSDPTGYGRILRNSDQNVCGIVEEKDATFEQKNLKEVCTSVYCFAPKALFSALPLLSSNNAQAEYYLTDVPSLLANSGGKVETYEVKNSEEVMGVNTRWELALAGNVLRKRLLKELAESGVTIVDPETTYVDTTVKIGINTELLPMTILEGKVEIGEECIIGPFARIQNSVIGSRVQILSSNLYDAVLEDDVLVGPFANLRKGAVLRKGAKVGDFVEVKNCEMGEGASAAHLSYLGDAVIGAKANIGAGTITCNYDGFKKHFTHIGEGAFIGSNSTLVAPITIGENAMTAAGSTITEDIPEGSLGVGRSRQTTKEGWAARWRERK